MEFSKEDLVNELGKDICDKLITGMGRGAGIERQSV